MNIPAGGPGSSAVRSFLLALASQFTFGPDSGSVAIVRYASNALTLTSMMALEGPMVTSLEDVEYAIGYYTTGGQTDMAAGLTRCAAPSRCAQAGQSRAPWAATTQRRTVDGSSSPWQGPTTPGSTKAIDFSRHEHSAHSEQREGV